MGKIFSIILVILAAASLTALAQEQVKVYPTEIDDVLINPGIGFNTFQRFNGDTLNPMLRFLAKKYLPFTGSQNKVSPAN